MYLPQWARRWQRDSKRLYLEGIRYRKRKVGAHILDAGRLEVGFTESLALTLLQPSRGENDRRDMLAAKLLKLILAVDARPNFKTRSSRSEVRAQA